MKFRLIIIGLFLVLSVAFFSFDKNNQIERNHRFFTSLAIDNDTSFAPNKEEGWSSMSFYFSRDTADSTGFEVILKNDNHVADWSHEQFIGTITVQNLLPVKNLSVEYKLLPDNVWNVRITTEGKTYISILKGIGPSEIPAIIPIKIKYSNNG